MVQSTLRSIGQTFLNTFKTLEPPLWWLSVAALILLSASLVLFALDRAAFVRVRDWVVFRAQRGLAWLLVLIVTLLGVFALGVVREHMLERFRVQGNAQFSTLEDPAGGQTIQYSPSVAYSVETTYSRDVTIPGFLGRKLDTLGAAQVIAPYLVDPSSENIRALTDRFRRSGNDLVFSREVTRIENKPIPLEDAELNVHFDFGDTGAGRSYYRATFNGKYRFINPNPRKTLVRFNFPLPAQSGTLSEFELKLNGVGIKQPDLSNGYLVETLLEPNAKAEVQVRYKNQGAGTWSYDLGQRREPIKHLKLSIDSPRLVKFLRGSLYPTTRAGLVWDLKDVITSQAVVLGFPERSLRETLTKVFSFMPLALLLAVAWSFAWAWRWRLKLAPAKLALMVLSMTLGLGLGGVLLGYLSPTLAGCLGAVLAGVLGVLSLGLGFALPVALGALTPLVFLSVGNAGLLLGLLGLVMLLGVLPIRFSAQNHHP